MSCNNVLRVNQREVEDNAITNLEFHSYQSYTAAELKYNDECRIVVQQQELLTAPGNSYLQIQGKLLKQDGTLGSKCKLVNNFIAFLFEEIRFELGGIVVDRVKNPGITTSMKGYISYTPHESAALMNAGWVPFENYYNDFDSVTGSFDVCCPLSTLLGFAEDYKKIIINLRQELVLIRATDDLNALFETTGHEKGKIEISKIIWKVPHYTVSDYEKLKILNTIEKNIPITIAHRKWDLFTYPLLQQSHAFTWVLKSSSALEKPRFIIFGLQTDNKNKITKDPSKFNHCNLRNIKLYLNSQSYPYENLNLNYNHNQFSLAYEMYARFQQSYYANKKILCEPLLNPSAFKSLAPLIVIDCSYQNETLKQGAVDARLEFDTTSDIPANTSAYCLVLHEHFVKYEPLTGVVRIS